CICRRSRTRSSSMGSSSSRLANEWLRFHLHTGRPSMMKIQSAAVTFLSLVAVCSRAPGTGVSTGKALDELVAADRAFAAASSGVDVVTGVTQMLARAVVMLSAGGVARGRESGTALLRVSPISATGRRSWKPIGAQLSRGGDVGYTYGYFRVDV